MRVNRLKIQPKSGDMGLYFRDDNYPHESENGYSHNSDVFSIPYLRQTFRWLSSHKDFKTIGYYANW